VTIVLTTPRQLVFGSGSTRVIAKAGSTTMGGYWFELLLIGTLILLNGALSGSEVALISLREGQLRRLERQGTARARKLVRLARDPNRYLATIQIGITLAGYLASATAAVTLALPLVSALGLLGKAAYPVAVVFVTLVLTFVNLVIAELAPKRFAMQHALRWSLLVARPLDALSRMSRPIVWLVSAASDFVVRILGGNPSVVKEQLSSEELASLVAAHRGLTPEQRTIISGALDIHDRTVREVLVPRGSVVMLLADMPVEQARTILGESGHLRAPVVSSPHLDNVTGAVHLRDLLGTGRTVAQVARPYLSFPDSVRLPDALRRFQAEREQLAVVIDEHGGVSGIVTLEDVLEEIVGEIYSESDRNVVSVEQTADGSLILPGTFPIHDLADIGVELSDTPDGDYTTVAGLVMTALGRVPTAPGDRIESGGWAFEVTNTWHRAITEVKLTPCPREKESFQAS